MIGSGFTHATPLSILRGIMKVKILEKCYTGIKGNMYKGEEHDLEDRIANKLITRGFAEEAKEKKKKKSLIDRAVKALETPEDE